MTQAMLGQRVGYAAVTIHKIETDQLRPSRQMAQKLADELAIDLSERDAFIRFARDDSRADPPVFVPPVPKRPPVLQLSPHPNNLPIAPTRVLGREEEVKIGCTLLRGDNRLLTLTGTGGIGKTRLGLAIATDLVDHFPDGVWFVDLAPLTDPELVIPAVARVLGVRENLSQLYAAALVGALRERHLLLMLDNCEHVVDACARLIDEILRGASNVCILTTSRMALRVPGEVSRAVRPLALPAHNAARALDELQNYASLRLFAERAAAVEPQFAVTHQNFSALVKICQRLDGIPLAIELAAARVTVLSLEQILTRLDDRFRLLTGGSRTALPPHQTLRATLDWSYDLLSERERAVFQRLGVFAGSWTLEAADTIVAGDETEPPDILDSLAALIEQSLVIVDDHAGQRRYRLLETLRQYAWERLLEARKAGDAQRRHFKWYLGLAEHSDPELPGAQQRPGFTQLTTEHDNLCLALTWSLEYDPAGAVRLAGCLAEFWRRGGHHAEGRRWLNAVLPITGPSTAPVEACGRVLLGIGQLAADAGEFGPDQVARAEESVQLFRNAGNERALVDALQHLGRCVLESGGGTQRVQQAFDESLRVARSRGDQHGIGFALANLAHLAWSQGNAPKHLNCAQRRSGTSEPVEMPCSRAWYSGFSAGTH
jgi:predicted ATPase/DNA-binding XRE family transcriptional regulator